MKLLGVKNASELGPRYVSATPATSYRLVPVGLTRVPLQINTRKVERDIFDGDANLETFGLWEKVRSKL